MSIPYIILLIVTVLALLYVATAFICFYITFYVSQKEKDKPADLPVGKIYDPYHPLMKRWMEDVKSIPFTPMQVVSHDGLTLYGKYYECQPGAPIELMMHGYRGRAERDLCGGIQRCFSIGHNVLLVDQRASGKSDGHVITFGVKESLDCLSWVRCICDTFGSDTPIMLTGISMGATTVLMAASHPLPDNVIGVLADCGFTTAKEIIKKVITDMKLPHFLYEFIRLGAKLFGGFDPSTADIPTPTVPVIFFHGENDSFVPYEMSIQNFNHCTAPKQLVIVPNAEHGLSYVIDEPGYLRALTDFCIVHNIPVSVMSEK